jgi:hypothetical protein
VDVRARPRPRLADAQPPRRPGRRATERLRPPHRRLGGYVTDPDGNWIALVSKWEWLEATERISDDCTTIVFGVFLAGPGRVELRNAELGIQMR